MASPPTRTTPSFLAGPGERWARCWSGIQRIGAEGNQLVEKINREFALREEGLSREVDLEAEAIAQLKDQQLELQNKIAELARDQNTRAENQRRLQDARASLKRKHREAVDKIEMSLIKRVKQVSNALGTEDGHSNLPQDLKADLSATLPGDPALNTSPASSSPPSLTPGGPSRATHGETDRDWSAKESDGQRVVVGHGQNQHMVSEQLRCEQSSQDNMSRPTNGTDFPLRANSPLEDLYTAQDTSPNETQRGAHAGSRAHSDSQPSEPEPTIRHGGVPGNVSLPIPQPTPDATVRQSSNAPSRWTQGETPRPTRQAPEQEQHAPVAPSSLSTPETPNGAASGVESDVPTRRPRPPNHLSRPPAPPGPGGGGGVNLPVDQDGGGPLGQAKETGKSKRPNPSVSRNTNARLFTGITDPIVGEIYQCYFSKEWYLVAVLPLYNLDEVGIQAFLPDTQLALPPQLYVKRCKEVEEWAQSSSQAQASGSEPPVNTQQAPPRAAQRSTAPKKNLIPKCYDSEDGVILGWAPGFGDGGPSVRKRKFPCLFLEANLVIPEIDQPFRLPDHPVLSWVEARDLRPRDFKHLLGVSWERIDGAEKVARKFEERARAYRLGRARDSAEDRADCSSEDGRRSENDETASPLSANEASRRSERLSPPPLSGNASARVDHFEGGDRAYRDLVPEPADGETRACPTEGSTQRSAAARCSFPSTPQRGERGAGTGCTERCVGREEFENSCNRHGGSEETAEFLGMVGDATAIITSQAVHEMAEQEVERPSVSARDTQLGTQGAPTGSTITNSDDDVFSQHRGMPVGLGPLSGTDDMPRETTAEVRTWAEERRKDGQRRALTTYEGLHPHSVPADPPVVQPTDDRRKLLFCQSSFVPDTMSGRSPSTQPASEATPRAEPRPASGRHRGQLGHARAPRASGPRGLWLREPEPRQSTAAQLGGGTHHSRSQTPSLRTPVCASGRPTLSSAGRYGPQHIARNQSHEPQDAPSDTRNEAILCFSVRWKSMAVTLVIVSFWVPPVIQTQLAEPGRGTVDVCTDKSMEEHRERLSGGHRAKL